MELEIHYANDWAALYVDGQLDPDTVGDSHNAEEKAFELLGVKQVYDNAFMRGQRQRDGVAQTLDQVAEYRQDRHRRYQEAADKRAAAARLLAEADNIGGPEVTARESLSGAEQAALDAWQRVSPDTTGMLYAVRTALAHQDRTEDARTAIAEQTARDMLAHYSATLDEVYRLRRALAYETRASVSLLSYASLPVTARAKIEDQVTRMSNAARGYVTEAYADVPPNRWDWVMRECGMRPTLTRAQWEQRTTGEGR